MCRILCTADVHIGRCSSVGGEASNIVDFTALAAFERLVEAAIGGQASAVIIAGDLYDSLPAQYESRPRVKSAFERLRAKDIPAIAVAGNHDHSALPAFVQSHAGLVHLFATDRWEAKQIGNIRFVGRSFAGPFERDSILRNFDLPAGNTLTVGLMHADVNAQSPYSPTPIELFRGKGVEAWVLGHVHVPRRFEHQTIVYPGSPQALDWGETGQHGFCWLEITNGRIEFKPCCPLSTVQYEHVELELLPGEALEEKLGSLASERRQQRDGLESMQFRVDVRLRRGANPELPERDQVVPFGGNDTYCICSRTVVPEIDLAVETRQADARGQAARLLLGLQGGGDPAWQHSALDLMSRVEAAMKGERTRLDLPVCEDVEYLRHGHPDEARRAVRSALERVLTTEGVAQ